MISFDQSLTHLVQQNLVTYEEALTHATNPDDFALTFRGVSKGTNAVQAPKPPRPGAPPSEPADDDLTFEDDGPGLQLDRKR